MISQRSIRTFGQAPDMIVALLSATACARGGLRESIGGAVANLAFLDWSHSSTGKKTPGGEYRTGKKTPGEPGHTRDTHGTRGRTRAHGSHRRTSQPSKPTNTQPARQRDDRSRGRLNSRRPGADRSPRPTQKRPPPANPTLPPPAPSSASPVPKDTATGEGAGTKPMTKPGRRLRRDYITTSTNTKQKHGSVHGAGKK